MANAAPNAKTRQVMVGSVALGGGAPCVVQSMLNLPLADVEGNLSQISRLQEAGCEVVRPGFLRGDLQKVSFASCCRYSFQR